MILAYGGLLIVVESKGKPVVPVSVKEKTPPVA